MLQQQSPILTSDEFAKFELDYKDKHGQFHLGDLKKFDQLNDIGAYPYKGTKLVLSAKDGSVYVVFQMRNVTETPKPDDPCIGTFVTSIFWVRADEELIPRAARSQVVSSCLLGRKQIGEPKINDGKLTVNFADKSGKHELTYDMAQPESGIKVDQ